MWLIQEPMTILRSIVDIIITDKGQDQLTVLFWKSCSSDRTSISWEEQKKTYAVLLLKKRHFKIF